MFLARSAQLNNQLLGAAALLLKGELSALRAAWHVVGLK
jgi:hypothetical protein